MTKPTTLTGNDIALAASACSLAAAWWREKPRSKLGNARMKELKALCDKLQALDDTAYPHVRYDESEGFNVPEDYGDEPIMKFDDDVLARTTKLGT